MPLLKTTLADLLIAAAPARRFSLSVYIKFVFIASIIVHDDPHQL